MSRVKRSTAERAVVVAVAFVLTAMIGLVVPSPAAAAGTGTLSGTVVDASAAPVGGITVEARQAFWGLLVDSTTTAGDGTYSLDLPPGSYRVRFTDPGGTFPDRWSGNSPTWPGSTALTVTDGATTTLDMAYPAADTIEGTVTDGTNPLQNITVELINSAGWALDSQLTGADGTYSFPNLTAGPYNLFFSDAGGTWAHQYNGPSNSQGTAPKINVVGNTTHTIDQVMLPGGTLTGTVTIGANPPAIVENGVPSPAGMYAVALDPANAEVVGLGGTALDGTWSIDRLPPGPYKIAIVDPLWFGSIPDVGYRPVFVPDGDVETDLFGSWAAATTYTLPTGGTTPTATQAIVGWDCTPDILPGQDRSAQDLSQMDLRGCDLHDTTFATRIDVNSGVAADLTDADLRNADLSGSVFADATDGIVGELTVAAGLTWAPLDRAHLSGADLSGATVSSGPQLGYADLDLTGTDLTGVVEPYLQTFCGIGCYGIWYDTTLFQFGWHYPRLNYPNPPVDLAVGSDAITSTYGLPLLLRGTALPDGALMGNLPGADLREMRCHGCSFVDTTAPGLPGDLSGADLTGADLTGSTLASLDLAGAILAAANLTSANLLGSTGTPTGGSTATYGATTCPDGAVTDGVTVLTCVGHGLDP